MKGDKLFLDTNILIYAYDASAGAKHDLSRKILIECWNSGNGIISTQVLQEFFVSLTGKIPKPLNIPIAREIIEDLLRWDVIINDGDSILGAVEIHTQHKYSFWDSLIIEAAVRGESKYLITEDLSHGQVIRGVEFKNPFLDT
jgi:predicted nucleic acid-binding protein